MRSINSSDIIRTMKISELIEKLQKAKAEHGDIEVGHDNGSEFGFEYVEYLTPLYPKDSSLKEDKTQPAWCIELS